MVRPILIYPDPRLKMKSRPVTQFGTEDLRSLVADMTETMRHANGLGLAAIQIGEAIRLMVMEVNYDKEDRGEALALCNMEILSTEGIQVGEEGCLSIPEVREELERPQKVTLKGRLLDGTEKTYEFEGLLARCIFHELDHMNGQLFIEKLPAIKRLLLKTRLKDLKKQFASSKA